ncbi:hypothetical protein AAVH_43442 [Aphelenchoides avenae]|nr:hypothetical protein AAVH_43442 [Aphelenchus avenae]
MAASRGLLLAEYLPQNELPLTYAYAEGSNSTVLGFSYVELVDMSISKPLSYWCPKLTVDKSVVSEFYHIDLFVRKWFIEPPFASFQYRGYGFFFLEVSAIHI